MNPSARLSAALLVGLILWLPSLSASMSGEIDLPEAAVRYLIAFLLARVAVGFLARLIDSYSAPQGHARHHDVADVGAARPAAVEGEGDTPMRRSTDGPSPAVGLS